MSIIRLSLPGTVLDLPWQLPSTFSLGHQISKLVKIIPRVKVCVIHFGYQRVTSFLTFWILEITSQKKILDK